MRTGRSFRWMTGAALLALAALAGGCAVGEADGEKTVQGTEALEAGDYARAQSLFEEAILNNEEEVPAYRGLGLAYMGLGEYGSAETAFAAALEYTDEKMPENTQDLLLYLATAQYRLAEYEEVIDTGTELLENSEEGNADAYFLRGAGYLHEGQTEEAAADFQAAVALEPEDYDLYLNIYACYESENLSGIGGEYLQSALNIRGEELEDHYNRGRIYYYLENYEQAQQELIGPVEEKYEPAMYLIGRVYLGLQDYDHALAVYRQILEEFGESAACYNGLALCEIQNGDYDAALSCISQGLALEGTEGKQELYFNEIVAYEKKLDFETAKEKAQAYVEKYPTDEAGQKEWTFLSTR